MTAPASANRPRASRRDGRGGCRYHRSGWFASVKPESGDAARAEPPGRLLLLGRSARILGDERPCRRHTSHGSHPRGGGTIASCGDTWSIMTR